MWNNLMKGVKPDDEEEEIPMAQQPIQPQAPKLPAPTPPKALIPGAHPNLMSWAKAAALKKLRGY